MWLHKPSVLVNNLEFHVQVFALTPQKPRLQQLKLTRLQNGRQLHKHAQCHHPGDELDVRKVMKLEAIIKLNKHIVNL
jgi:hypothetical protein